MGGSQSKKKGGVQQQGQAAEAAASAPSQAAFAPSAPLVEFSYLSMEADAADPQPPSATLSERCRAGFLLSAIGDAFGYNNGNWEHCSDWTKILGEVARRGGLSVMTVNGMKCSDETIMVMATANALCQNCTNVEQLHQILAKAYVDAGGSMGGRSGDQTVSASLRTISPVPGVFLPYALNFSNQHTSCAAAVRAWPIGIRFPAEEQLDQLVAMAIDSCRITHHHPTAYLSAVAAALFTSFSLRGVRITSWGALLLQTLPKARAYIETTGRNVQENLAAWSVFEDAWKQYLEYRNLLQQPVSPSFPSPNGALACNESYKELATWGVDLPQGASVSLLPGELAHHCSIIAFDAVLTAYALGLGASRRGWIAVLERAALHCGDGDGTGALAGAWWGCLWGVAGVPGVHLDKIELRNNLLATADALQTACGWELDPPLMPEPLRRGSQITQEAGAWVEQAQAQLQQGATADAFERQSILFNEEITKLSIQMDSLEGLTDPERDERRRLLKEFDTLERALHTINPALPQH